MSNASSSSTIDPTTIVSTIFAAAEGIALMQDDGGNHYMLDIEGGTDPHVCESISVSALFGGARIETIARTSIAEACERVKREHAIAALVQLVRILLDDRHSNTTRKMAARDLEDAARRITLGDECQLESVVRSTVSELCCNREGLRPPECREIVESMDLAARVHAKLVVEIVKGLQAWKLANLGALLPGAPKRKGPAQHGARPASIRK